MARLPTKRQKKFVEEFIKTGNGRRSVMKAYGTENVRVADVLAYRNIRNPIVVGYMSKILNVAGLTDEKIAESLNKVVDAGLTRRSLKHTRPDDVLRGLEMAMKVKGLYAPTKKQIETKSLSMSFEGKTEGELMGMLDKLNQEISQFKVAVTRGKEITNTVEQPIEDASEDIEGTKAVI